MSPPGRPKGEFRSAQHEGRPVSAPGCSQVAGSTAAMLQARKLGYLAKAQKPDLNLHSAVARKVNIRLD